MEENNKILKFSDGDVVIWADGGIMIKALTSYGDPVELSDEEAIELGEALIKLAKGKQAQKIKQP